MKVSVEPLARLYRLLGYLPLLPARDNLISRVSIVGGEGYRVVQVAQNLLEVPDRSGRCRTEAPKGSPGVDGRRASRPDQS
jgi:hypothetical protein